MHNPATRVPGKRAAPGVTVWSRRALGSWDIGSAVHWPDDECHPWGLQVFSLLMETVAVATAL
jgi:hypothetical protein